MNQQELYKENIAAFLNILPEQIFLYWKGRVALYAILKAMDIKPGDEVILPGLTCVVVPNAILYTGAKPIYVDIDKHTFNPSFEKITAAVTSKTRVIIVQNTFGFSSDVDKIAAWAKNRNIYTIEDCAHGFGGTFKGRPNGTYCDASFFSTQWNKPFSTGIGGFALLNNTALKHALEEMNKELTKPGLKDNISLWILIRARRYLLMPATYFILRRLYRWLSKYNLVIGSSVSEELESPVLPGKFFKAHCRVQATAGLSSLRSFNELASRRKQNALLYTNFLQRNGKSHVQQEMHQNHSFLKYPILVNDRPAFEKAAERSSIELGDWFISPLHPITEGFSKWLLSSNELPVAAEISSQLSNLPTETKHPQRVITFLEKNIDLIL